MKLFVALFALAAAQDGSQDASQGADQGAGYGDADQGAGYGEQSYGGESYATASVGYAAPVAPICCVSACPDEAPFFNPATCGCVPGYVEQEPSYATASYAAPTESYGESTQQSGYRKLQDYGYGGQVATASYGAAAFTSGPDGTIDTRNMRINRTGLIVLWVAFAILFLLACYYLRMFHWYYSIAESMDDISGGLYVFTYNTGDAAAPTDSTGIYGR